VGTDGKRLLRAVYASQISVHWIASENQAKNGSSLATGWWVHQFVPNTFFPPIPFSAKPEGEKEAQREQTKQKSVFLKA